MKRIGLTGCAAALVTTVATFLAAQSPKQNTFQDAPAPVSQPQPASMPVVAPILGPPSRIFPIQASSPLQKRFLELSQQKADMLKEDQLQKAVKELEVEVDGFNADQQLQKAIKLLNEIVEKHDGTEAAKAARAALDVMENQRVWRRDQNLVPVQPRSRSTFDKPAPFEDVKPSTS